MKLAERTRIQNAGNGIQRLGSWFYHDSYPNLTADTFSSARYIIPAEASCSRPIIYSILSFSCHLLYSAVQWNRCTPVLATLGVCIPARKPHAQMVHTHFDCSMMRTFEILSTATLTRGATNVVQLIRLSAISDEDIVVKTFQHTKKIVKLLITKHFFVGPV